MKVSVFIATSLDGYIARQNHALDWLTGANDQQSTDQDYGYFDFIKTVDVLVMGRSTFDVVVKFDGWKPPEDTRVVVLTHRDLDIPQEFAECINVMSGSPQTMIAQLEAAGAQHLYIDGGNVIQQFLKEDLVDDLIISTAPVLIGSGIPLFAELNADIKLKVNSSKVFDSGLTQTHYTTDRRTHQTSG